MAKKRGVRVAIVVEDRALERFSREVLLKLGFRRHELRVIPYPVAQGSGKAWVDKQYPTEVQKLRSKGSPNIGIVVGTDADEASVSERRNQLAGALNREALAPRRKDERIVLWMPKWNVETWILYFAGDVRDEGKDYKREVRAADFRATAVGFVHQYRQFKIDDTLRTAPSLRLAYEETMRLDA